MPHVPPLFYNNCLGPCLVSENQYFKHLGFETVNFIIRISQEVVDVGPREGVAGTLCVQTITLSTFGMELSTLHY